MFKKKPKAGIISKYNFDRIHMNESIEVSDQKTISKRLRVIKSNPDAERYMVQQKWALSKLPTAVLKETNYMKDDIRILAEISYKHITDPIQPRPNILESFSKMIALWAVIGIASITIFFAVLYKIQTKDPDCIIWFNQDIPYKIVIDTSEYRLNSDGTMPKLTRLFLNPWQQQYIDSGQCVRRNR
jgi:hypothetical protein